MTLRTTRRFLLMKNLILIVVVLLSQLSYAQKRMTKTLSADNIDVINFNFDKVYKIKLLTHNSSSIIIEAQVEGENQEHIVLTNKRFMSSLYITSTFQPTFEDANDKLSAHKIISIELNIKVPEQKSIYIKSDIANVTGEGAYKKLTLELKSGNCEVTKFSGNALINTIEGDIEFHSNFAKINTSSKHGNIKTEELTLGDNTIDLNSINGDITVTKSQE